MPNLSRVNRERVELANELYRITGRAVAKVDAVGSSWSIENPTNSSMRETRWFKELEELSSNRNEAFHFSRVAFDMCMHGGKRAMPRC